MINPRCTIIFPVFNAKSFLEDSLDRIGAWLIKHRDVEVIFSDDGSTDGSGALLQHFCAEHEACRVIFSNSNRGKGHAVREALLLARGVRIAFTDIDLPYGLDILDAMRVMMDKNPDIAFLYGSRSHSDSEFQKYGFMRRAGRWFFSSAIRLLVLPEIPDTQCGVKMLSRLFADAVVDQSVIDRFAFDIELFVIADARGLVRKDFPVRLLRHKESSVRVIADTANMLKDVLRIRKRVRAKGYATHSLK